MTATMSPLERLFSPLAAAIVAVVGAIAGGTVYISFSGAMLGLIFTLAILGILASILDAIGLFPRSAPSATARASTSISSASTLVPTETTMAETDNTQPADAAAEVTATEAELLNTGRFAEYHLAKAKRLFATQNFKEAAYQAGASLAHDDLPEAKTLRQTALAAMK